MAIKIITLGRLPEEIEHKHICTYCSTEFSYTAKDGKASYDQREGGCIVVKCPLCSKDCHCYINTYDRW